MGMLMTVDMRNVYFCFQSPFDLRAQLRFQLTALNTAAVKALGKGNVIRQKQALLIQKAADLACRQHRRHTADKRQMHTYTELRIFLRQLYCLLPAGSAGHQRGAGNKALLIALDNTCVNQRMQTEIICINN